VYYEIAANRKNEDPKSQTTSFERRVSILEDRIISFHNSEKEADKPEIFRLREDSFGHKHRYAASFTQTGQHFSGI